MAPKKHLIDIKLALAKKYDSLSRLTNSKPRRDKLAREALKYRRQAKNIQDRLANAAK